MDEKLRVAIDLLQESRSKKRESGAKRLRKLESPLAGKELLTALEKEMLDVRTWSTQYHLILALGHSTYAEALPFLLELAKKEFEATIIYMALGDSILRLSVVSTSLEDTLDLIHSHGNFRLNYGAYRALAFCRMVPRDAAIRDIIRIASDPEGADIVKGYPNDVTGLRKWVAAACAGWKRELVEPFLDDCARIEDQHLTIAVENARKGKYVNWGGY